MTEPRDRVIVPNEAAASALSDALSEGDRRAALEALTWHLAAALSVAEPGQVAALTKQLAERLRELDSLPVAKGVGKLESIAGARADRVANAAHPRVAG